MHLSKRLQVLADLVEEHTVVDVGCDHALLDIYLAKEKGLHCIASDINQNAYEVAKRNIEKENLQDRISLFLTDGTKGISLTEDSTLVLAGMGTRTMISILEHTKVLPKQLLLQSNKELKLLREFICKIGYFIEKEEIVIEGKIYNVILSCKKGKVNYDEWDLEFGPIIRRTKKEEKKKYLHFLISNEEKILKNLDSNQLKLKTYHEQKLEKLNSEL